MTVTAGRPLLGLIEGFYGPPWTWAERDRMIDFLAAQGFDLYVYAPKDDPLHRARWRGPLPEEELAHFERLTQRAAVAGVEFSYGLSPIDLGFGALAEVDTVVAKCLQLVERGVPSFGLLFDDLPVDLPPSDDERTEAARWQASVANEVLRAVRESGAGGRFLFCPTEYCSGAVEPTPYLRTLGETLEPGIEVFWTGPQVCSHTITASDLTAVTEGLMRPPLLWDNYPVNDGAMRWDPHIRPLRGRGADLPGACSGIVANGAIQAEATKIALHTFAAYWRDPAGYDPETAWGPALTAVAGDAGDAAVLRVLGELASRSPIEPGQEPPVPWLEAFWTRWETVDERDAAITEVEAHLERLSDAAVHLIAAAEHRPLPREMEPWARKLSAWVETAGSALGVLGGTSDPLETGARLERTLALPHRVSDGRFEAFVRRCLDFQE